MEIKRDIIDVTKESVYNYALATFDRAFPHVADGLKPSSRRIIFAMWKNKMWGRTRKCGSAIGVVQPIHPHGDMAIYGTMIRLAQPFAMNHPLLDWQGNYGTITGESASQARYTECKLSDFARDILLEDLDESSVDYQEDESMEGMEPVYLPTKIPLVLVEGGSGIGEAFSTSIAPHNLSETIDRCIQYINNKNITNSELVDGYYPDFPTGGIIVNGDEVSEAYKNGENCSIRVKGRAHIDNKKNIIRITDIPYGVVFHTIENTIVDRVRDKTNMVFTSIQNIFPEKIKKGEYMIPHEVYCKRGSNLVEILENLYSHTPLMYSIRHMPIINYGSRVVDVTIKDIIVEWYKYRVKIKVRKITHQISVAETRLHVLKGLLTIYDKMDDVIRLIRGSKDREAVINGLQKKFGLTPIQSRGIADMKLYSLSKVSKGDLINDIKSLESKLGELREDLLKIDELIVDELEDIKSKYGRPRHTEVLGEEKCVKEVSMKNGALLYSLGSFAAFDNNNVIAGKSIVNGIKPKVINGQKRIDIVGSHLVDGDLVGVVVFTSDGMGKKYDKINFINTWLNGTDDESVIIIAAMPIYKGDDENDDATIVLINDKSKIKRIRVSDLSNRKVNTGNVIDACISRSKDDYVFMLDSEIKYYNIPVTDIPLLSRGASGVNLNAGNINDIKLTVIPKSNTNVAVLLEDKNGEVGYIMPIATKDLINVGRTRKPKRLMKAKRLTTSGISSFDSSKKDDKFILVGRETTKSVDVKTIKEAKKPVRVGLVPIGLIQLSV